MPSLHRASEPRTAQADRLERVTTGRRPSPPAFAAPYASAYPPLPRVTRRGASIDAPSPTTARDLTARHRDRVPAQHMSLTPQASQLAALAPPELARLTNQVVDAIDRRLAAHRERHGRI